MYRHDYHQFDTQMDVSVGYAEGKLVNPQAVVTAGRGVVFGGGRLVGSIRRCRLAVPSPFVWAS